MIDEKTEIPRLHLRTMKKACRDLIFDLGCWEYNRERINELISLKLEIERIERAMKLEGVKN